MVFALVALAPLVWTVGAMGDRFSDQASKALKIFKKQLRKTQIQASSEERPAKGVISCSVQAPLLTEKANSKATRVGRSSHKLRNPRNKPKKWMLPLIEEFKATTLEKPASPKTVKISEKKMGYAEPIYVEQFCLTCHGQDLKPTIRLELERRFPKDKATGFQVGEFRGIFWAEMPIGEK